MRRLYVVTHPESEHHVSRLVGGWYDSGLTERGLRQAAVIGERIRELVPGDSQVELYSSDLRRAAQTAEAIAQQVAVEPRFLRGLREKSYGMAEGRAQSWLDERFVPPPPTGDRMHHHEGIAGAETRHELASRVYDALGSVLGSPCAHQVIVTHGFALTFVVAAWIGLPLDAAGHVGFRSHSGGITVLEQDDYFHNRAVVTLDDTSHLAAE
ncbi:MAG: Phosphoglycerate mutase [uncultured Nocardioidaceae bacterium]|uniref:Phosphoglycerate mutase n=1 Tax=uncultured Nocardioidaceae bacterium TaxID=253824 RepID=A0A6J4L5W8_9ACTN|nr:MAG: Phosphoglycerate mutase [uncultured Nocardioidaceae bacterium]